MWVTRRFLCKSKNSAFTALTIALSLGSFGGCVMGHDSGTGSAAMAENQAASALRDKSPSDEGRAPLTCSLEWSEAAMDSVLNCPDPRPPKPR